MHSTNSTGLLLIGGAALLGAGERKNASVHLLHYVTFFIIIQIATYVLYLGKLFLEFVI